MVIFLVFHLMEIKLLQQEVEECCVQIIKFLKKERDT